LQELAEISSRNELRSVKCEREVDSMEFAEYMMKFIGKQFKGTVTNIANFGCYVQLENTIEGFVNIRNIGEDFFSYEEKSNELIGKNKGMRIMFGKKVTVEVIAADKNTRKIEFKIIS
jgi:ribonuclease R